MALDKPFRRLPLRDMMTDAEKRVRDLIDHLATAWVTRAADLHELSRPARKKSHFPTVGALLHAIERLSQVTKETGQMLDTLEQELEEILAHAQRERVNR